MLERLVAGLVVIGALLWVASALATPDAPAIGDGAPPRPNDADGALAPETTPSENGGDPDSSDESDESPDPDDKPGEPRRRKRGASDDG